MAQYYKVTEAFQAKDKETKEPITDQYGNSKFMFKVENQPYEGWMSVQRKAGSSVEPGDQLYGIVDTWPDGRAKFVRQNPPEGERPPQQKKEAVSTGSLEDKVDKILEVVKKLEARFLGTETGAPEGSQDDFDGPVDLSEIDY